MSQIANLNQNPRARCIVSAAMPTLLRQGVLDWIFYLALCAGYMWLLLSPALLRAGREERWLLPEATRLLCPVKLCRLQPLALCISGAFELDGPLPVRALVQWATVATVWDDPEAGRAEIPRWERSSAKPMRVRVGWLVTCK